MHVILHKFIGSGKTASFLLPILSRIYESGPPEGVQVCTVQ